MKERYTLAVGTQVREEDFGLLFYQMSGPKLHFVASGTLLSEDFFNGKKTLEEWMRIPERASQDRVGEIDAISRALEQLKHKGVIVEC